MKRFMFEYFEDLDHWTNVRVEEYLKQFPNIDDLFTRGSNKIYADIPCSTGTFEARLFLDRKEMRIAVSTKRYFDEGEEWYHDGNMLYMDDEET